MQKISLGLVVVMVGGLITFGNASGTKIDIKKYKHISIEKNVSKQERAAYVRDGKDMGLKVIDNPKFSCTDVGYLKSNLLEEGALYGTKRKDGNVEVGQKGDFKVYSFVKYFKDGAFCVEKTYAKGDARYGKGSIAMLR